jgi:hypothetical protein
MSPTRADRELRVDVLPPDHRDGVLAGGEELGDGLPVEPVALVLEVTQRAKLATRVFEPFESFHRLVELLGATADYLSLLARLRPDPVDAVARDVRGRLVDVVTDVVDGGRQAVDVVPIERRHERSVEEVHHLPREAVALVLEVLDVAEDVSGRWQNSQLRLEIVTVRLPQVLPPGTTWEHARRPAPQ